MQETCSYNMCGFVSLCLCLYIMFSLYHISGKTYKNFVLIYSTLYTGNISYSKKQSVKYYHMSSCKVPLFFSDFKLNMTFIDRISKNNLTSNFICPSIGSLVVTCGQIDGLRTGWKTDIKTLRVAFRNFTSPHKKGKDSGIDDISEINYVGYVEYRMNE